MENKLKQYLENIQPSSTIMMDFGVTTLLPEHLENETVQKMLLTFPEFKNVKKINILHLPCYLGNKITGVPVECDDENLGDKDQYKFFTVPNMMYDPEKGELEFNEEIDLYTIDLTPSVYEPSDLTAEKLGCGIWIMPDLYRSTDFQHFKEIKIIYSTEGLKEMTGKTEDEVKEIIKKRILTKVEEVIDKGLKTNVPSKRNIIFRVSDRSVKKK